MIKMPNDGIENGETIIRSACRSEGWQKADQIFLLFRRQTVKIVKRFRVCGISLRSHFYCRLYPVSWIACRTILAHWQYCRTHSDRRIPLLWHGIHLLYFESLHYWILSEHGTDKAGHNICSLTWICFSGSVLHGITCHNGSKRNLARLTVVWNSDDFSDCRYILDIFPATCHNLQAIFSDLGSM